GLGAALALCACGCSSTPTTDAATAGNGGNGATPTSGATGQGGSAGTATSGTGGGAPGASGSVSVSGATGASGAAGSGGAGPSGGGDGDWAMLVAKDAPAALKGKTTFGRAHFYYAAEATASLHMTLQYAGTNGTGTANGPEPFPKLRRLETGTYFGSWQLGMDL